MQTNFETWNDLVHEHMHLSKLAGEQGEQLEQSFAYIVAFIQGRIELLERFGERPAERAFLAQIIADKEQIITNA